MLGPIDKKYVRRCVTRFASAVAFAAASFSLLSSLVPLSSKVFAQSDSQPYMVYVDQEGVSARCGPGGDYYRTDPLRHGQALEVYVETTDGWLGIRPPDDSFCWLPADVIKLSPSQDFGIVTEDNALAWIGTHLGKANKYLWQVQLSQGEEVAILGRAKREGPDGVKLWFRIVPPAGEFRWVHRDQIVTNPELLLREKPRADSRLADAEPTLAPQPENYVQSSPQESSRRQSTAQLRSILRSSDNDFDDNADNEPVLLSVVSDDLALPLPKPPADHIADADGRSTVTARHEQSAIGSGVMATTNERPQRDDASIARPYEAPLVAFTTRPTVQPIGVVRQETQQAREPVADSFDRRSAPRQTSGIAASLDSRDRAVIDESRVMIQTAVTPVTRLTVDPSMNQQSVDGLQLELSRLMSRSARASEVEPLLVAGTHHARTNVNEAERMRASMLVQRMQQYQAIARRRDGESASSTLLTPLSASFSGVSYPEPIQANPVPLAPSSEDPQADASGYLVQVFSARPDSPPFALTDRQGRTTYYVSPAPGVNLRRFLNQSINVRGASGYATGLDTPHIIATGAVRAPE